MSSAVRQSREIEQLKTLLFRAEAARLETVETDVASLRQYVGDANRLELATADILVGALERAEVKQSRELANAIAPSVVSAIRSEIKNSRELMVDALYPITGRLVSAAVANAFKQLVASLEQRLKSLTSTELWIGRIKSLATGRPISEFVLADSNSPRVNRLMLIERGNGRLIADWKREGIPDERADMLSAMVAAILEFSIQALAGEGNLQKLEFGGREIVLRDSPQFILAAECTGHLSAADDASINSLFFDTIESIDRGSECDPAMLRSLAASIESRPQSKRTDRHGGIILLALIALAATVLPWLAGISFSQNMVEQRTNATLHQLVDEQPLLTSFPVQLDFDHGNRMLTVSGIQPSEMDVAALVDALAKAAAPYRITNQIGTVPGVQQSASLQNDIAAMQQSLAHLQLSIDEMGEAIAQESKSSGQQLSDLRAQFTELRAQNADLSEQYAFISEQYGDLNAQHGRLQSIIDSPVERLSRFIATTAIFFESGNDAFIDGNEAERKLGQLAGLLANNDLRVRVVGYTDDSGSDSTNRMLAGNRAERVVSKLISLGVEPSRLIVVSRAASMPISDGSGAASAANRRVTFENAFRTEPSQ